MKKLNLQKFLEKNSVLELEKKLSIVTKRHDRYKNLILFKYDQISSPKHDEIVRECRGVILDENNNWNVVCFPYERFLNYGELGAAEIDWRTASIYEKLDGSLCTLFWYDNKWNVSTSGTPDASGDVGDFGFTFEELFWRVWKELDYELPNGTSSTVYCYMFELLTPFNRIVVQHKKNRIVLHGVRNVHNFNEETPEFYKWECVKKYPLGSVKEVIDSLQSMNPIEQEGYVVVDANFNRLKVKSPKYVALHRMIDHMSNKRMLEIVRTNEAAEFLTYFPEWSDLHKEIKDKYFALLIEVNQCYNTVKSIESQKDFALAVKDYPFAGALFTMRSGKITSFEDFFAKIQIKNLEGLLGLK